MGLPDTKKQTLGEVFIQAQDAPLAHLHNLGLTRPPKCSGLGGSSSWGVLSGQGVCEGVGAVWGSIVKKSGLDAVLSTKPAVSLIDLD
jgi:hypothetical protein